MALTPEDVLNKTFGTTQVRRGYDEREVDDFLDEIVATLRRLNKELEDCRAGSSVATSAPKMPRPPCRCSTPTSRGRFDREIAQRQEAERALAELQERVRREDEERIAAAAASGDEDQARAANLIADVNARADEAEQAARTRIDTANSRADEAEQLANERITRINQEADRVEAAAQERIAQVHHDEVVGSAQSRHDELLSSAQEQHDVLLAEAVEQRESMLTDARERAAGMVSEANDRRADILTDLESKRADLEGLIGELQSYEQTYRNRLRAYLQDQLAGLVAETPISQSLTEPAALS